MVAKEEMEEEGSRELVPTKQLLEMEQTVTVRVWPFSVGACPIVIFLRNLSLVSSTTVGREGKERLLRKGTEIKERRSGQWLCRLASGRS